MLFTRQVLAVALAASGSLSNALKIDQTNPGLTSAIHDITHEKAKLNGFNIRTLYPPASTLADSEETISKVCHPEASSRERSSS
jgi:hypothetical protein